MCVCVCVRAAWWADGLEKATESLILSDGFMRLHLLNPATISASAKNLHSRQDYRHRLHLIFPTLPPHQPPKCVRVCLISPSRSGFRSFLASDTSMTCKKRRLTCVYGTRGVVLFSNLKLCVIRTWGWFSNYKKRGGDKYWPQIKLLNMIAFEI